MKKIFRNISLASVGLLTPVLVFAATGGSANTPVGYGIGKIVADAQTIVAMLVPLMIGLAFVAFAWGLIKYLFGSDKADAKRVMLWGIIAMFILSSIWGIVAVLQGTLIGNTNSTNTLNTQIKDVKIPGL